MQNSGHTLFDNNTLYTAIRGMNLSSSFGATVSLFVPADGGLVNVNITGGGRGELNTETQSGIIKALKDAYGEPEVPESDKEEEDTASHSYLYYNLVSVRLSDSKGAARTAMYSAVDDEDDNTYRATMLYLNQPLSYNLGRWEFTLDKVVSVLGAKA